jgi:hypothetical protein
MIKIHVTREGRTLLLAHTLARKDFFTVTILERTDF